MRSSPVLLSSSLASHTSSFRSLFGILLVTLFISNNSYSQVDSCNTTDTVTKDQLELSAGWGGGHGGQPGVTFNNFSIKNIFGQTPDRSGEKFLSDTTREFRLTPQQKKRRTWIVG